MSHFSRIRIADREVLVSALRRQGYDVHMGPAYLTAFGQQRKVDLYIQPGGAFRSVKVGFVRSQGVYDIVADWWGVVGTSGSALRSAIEKAEREMRAEAERLEREMRAEMERVQKEIKRQYAISATKEKLAEQGFQIIEEEAQSDGQVRLMLRRLA
jgi:hypothetical protein